VKIPTPSKPEAKPEEEKKEASLDVDQFCHCSVYIEQFQNPSG
jgi:hypothetical protein